MRGDCYDKITQKVIIEPFEAGVGFQDQISSAQIENKDLRYKEVKWLL